jgi:hypothetical protein
LVGVVGAAALAAACVPPPSPDPAPPVITTFSAVAARTEAPVTATLRWAVSDPNGDQLTCRVDVDGDGATDRTIAPCPATGSVLTQLLEGGSRTAALEVDDGTSAPVTATAGLGATPGPSESYDIDFRFAPDVRPEFRAAFEAAAERWEQVILAGASDQALTLPGGLFGWTPPFSGTVDDLLVDVQTPALDGPGGLLGRAGGYLIRSGGKQPYYGVMELDSADLDGQLADGQLVTLITHELGHVLGLGGGYLLGGFVFDAFGPDPRFTGPAATAAWAELGGTGNVPLENTGGTGTAIVHWREAVFDRELMTGWQERSGAEPLSRVTAAALADLDYGVDLGAADPYRLTVAARAPGDEETGERLHTEPILPAGTTMVAGVPVWSGAR